MIETIASALDDFPLLCYDTSFPIKEIKENRRYRNVADLLICRSVSVREILKLCGADESITSGNASDYEKFRALCTVMPQLVGNTTARCISELLCRVFGIGEVLSLATCDEMWQTLNEVIERESLTPRDVISALGIPSVNYRTSPFAEIPNLALPDISLRPILDFGETPEARITDADNRCDSFGGFIELLNRHLETLIAMECPAVSLTLPRDFRFLRNSKKAEIDVFYHSLRAQNTLAKDELAALRTAICLHAATMAKRNDLTLLLSSEAEETELISLYDYLLLNGNVPMTVLKTELPCKRFTLRYTFRTDKGLPGILPLCRDLGSLASWFPLGSTILSVETARDIVGLAEGHYARRELANFLSSFNENDAPDSPAEDVAFGNILNRFGM